MSAYPVTDVSPSLETAIDHAPGLESAFALPPREECYEITDVEGRLPDIRGDYYLAGPARFGRGDLRYRHWLDGDGMVTALRFDESGVSMTHRLVRSRKLCDEEAAGRPLYRTFGTAFAGDRLLRGVGLESPVNVSVHAFAGRLLTFGEQGLPWELDPETLETRGQFDFGGGLNPLSPFSAHPRLDPRSGEMWSFGISFSAERPTLNLYRFDRLGRLVARRRQSLDFPCSMHDFGLSPSYSVFYCSPHLVDMEALRSGGTLAEALHWRPELGTRLLVFDREAGASLAAVDIGNSYCLHIVNCFEANGRLVVDVIELDRPVYDQYLLPDLFPDVRRAQPVRYVLDPEHDRLLETRSLDYRSMCDFPATDPADASSEYRHFWMLGISATRQPGRKFFDELVQADWHHGGPSGIYQAPLRSYLGGEPTFVPDAKVEGRGYVICQELDVERVESSFLIFDAHDVAAGPVARLRLERPIRLGFHATFVSRRDRPATTGERPVAPSADGC